MSAPREAPDRIWLQVSDDHGEPLEHDRTWCEDPVHDDDVEYVRVGRGSPTLREALGAAYHDLRFYTHDHADGGCGGEAPACHTCSVTLPLVQAALRSEGEVPPAVVKRGGQYFARPSGPGSDVGPFSTLKQAREWLAGDSDAQPIPEEPVGALEAFERLTDHDHHYDGPEEWEAEQAVVRAALQREPVGDGGMECVSCGIVFDSGSDTQRDFHEGLCGFVSPSTRRAITHALRSSPAPGTEAGALEEAAALLQRLLQVTDDPQASYPNCPCAEVYERREEIAATMTRLRAALQGQPVAPTPAILRTFADWFEEHARYHVHGTPSVFGMLRKVADVMEEDPDLAPVAGEETK